jgi:hypothetical protein
MLLTVSETYPNTMTVNYTRDAAGGAYALWLAGHKWCLGIAVGFLPRRITAGKRCGATGI